MADTVSLTLPEPPAANRYLRTHGRVTYKTREAKAYCELVYNYCTRTHTAAPHAAL